MTKYGSRATTLDGIRFASKREATRWAQLMLLARAGEIGDLERQYPIPLEGKNGPILTPTGRHMRYVADFRYFDIPRKAWVVEDAKGFATPEFRIKRAILAAMGMEVRLS